MDENPNISKKYVSLLVVLQCANDLMRSVSTTSSLVKFTPVAKFTKAISLIINSLLRYLIYDMMISYSVRDYSQDEVDSDQQSISNESKINVRSLICNSIFNPFFLTLSASLALQLPALFFFPKYEIDNSNIITHYISSVYRNIFLSLEGYDDFASTFSEVSKFLATAGIFSGLICTVKQFARLCFAIKKEKKDDKSLSRLNKIKSSYKYVIFEAIFSIYSGTTPFSTPYNNNSILALLNPFINYILIRIYENSTVNLRKHTLIEPIREQLNINFRKKIYDSLSNNSLSQEIMVQEWLESVYNVLSDSEIKKVGKSLISLQRIKQANSEDVLYDGVEMEELFNGQYTRTVTSISELQALEHMGSVVSEKGNLKDSNDFSTQESSKLLVPKISHV